MKVLFLDNVHDDNHYESKIIEIRTPHSRFKIMEVAGVMTLTVLDGQRLDANVRENDLTFFGVDLGHEDPKPPKKSKSSKKKD